MLDYCPVCYILTLYIHWYVPVFDPYQYTYSLRTPLSVTGMDYGLSHNTISHLHARVMVQQAS